MTDELVTKQQVIDEIKELMEWHDFLTEDRLIEHIIKLKPTQQKICYWRRAKPTDPLSFKGCYDECSVCGKVVFFGHEENYCPGCGSKTGGYLFG